jgi:hypothetical protein
MKSAVLAPLLMASMAHGAVTSDGLYKGENLVNAAKEILGDAMGFIKNVADSTVDMTRASLETLQESEKFAEFMGARGISFNADDLLDRSLMDNLKNSQTFEQALDALEAAIEDHCYPSEYIPSEKVNSKCTGPEVELELKPKTCYIDATGHSIDCEPAKLVMRKKPAKCTYKHHSAVEWEGDWCAIEKYHGVETLVTKGGDTYTTTVESLKNGSLWNH